jgi:hypothetical protein
MDYYQTHFLDMTSGCQVGDKIFFNFNYSSTAHQATAPTNSQVVIVGDPSNPNEPGLIFTAPGAGGTSLWSVNGSSTLANPLYIDSTISFTVAVVGLQPLLIDASLDFDNQFAVTGKGVADIGETIFFPSTSTSTTLAVDSFKGPFTSLTTFPNVSFLQVTKDVIVSVPVTVGSVNSGSATITQFREGFSEAPEPVSTVLLTSGLAGLAFLRRRR